MSNGRAPAVTFRLTVPLLKIAPPAYSWLFQMAGLLVGLGSTMFLTAGEDARNTLMVTAFSSSGFVLVAVVSFGSLVRGCARHSQIRTDRTPVTALVINGAILVLSLTLLCSMWPIIWVVYAGLSL